MAELVSHLDILLEPSKIVIKLVPLQSPGDQEMENSKEAGRPLQNQLELWGIMECRWQRIRRKMWFQMTDRISYRCNMH